MKVSVIIPVYNGEEYLVQCLDSVVNQDIESKEVICVDDGSKDASVEIIRQYQEKYDYIKLLQQTNQGAAIARNNALKMASGKYIAFMDADDYYLDKTGLRIMVEACEKNNCVICGSLRKAVKGDVYKDLEAYREELANQNEPKVLEYLKYQYDYDYQSHIFSSEFLKQNKLEFPNLRRYQDPPFFAKAMWLAEKFVVVPVELYCYRSRTAPMKFSFIQANDLLKGIKENILFAKEHQLNILYEQNIRRLNDDYFYVLSDTIYAGNMVAVKELLEIDELVKEESSDNDLSGIWLVNEIKNMLHHQHILNKRDYNFPYDEIAEGSKVAVYGAGRGGKGIVATIQDEKYCYLSSWVDKNYLALQAEAYEVQSPESLLDADFDYIVVAVESERVFDEISESISRNGWNKGKPIIGPVKKKGCE